MKWTKTLVDISSRETEHGDNGISGLVNNTRRAKKDA